MGRDTDLASTTTPDVPIRPLLLVPVGSTEQHGPHLPFGTDTVIAQHVAERVAERLSNSGDVVIAPPLWFGSSGEHQGFPGTLSIGREALHLVVLELVRSAAHWARRVVLVNAHGGNASALTDSVQQLRKERHDVRLVHCQVRGGDAHAGRTETSLMLHLRPDLVRLARAQPGNSLPLPDLMPGLISPPVCGRCRPTVSWATRRVLRPPRVPS